MSQSVINKCPNGKGHQYSKTLSGFCIVCGEPKGESQHEELPPLDVTSDEHWQAFEDTPCPDDRAILHKYSLLLERVLCRERQLRAVLAKADSSPKGDRVMSMFDYFSMALFFIITNLLILSVANQLRDEIRRGRDK